LFKKRLFCWANEGNKRGREREQRAKGKERKGRRGEKKRVRE